MKKPEDPGKVVIVHHPPQPDTTQPKSQPQTSSDESRDAGSEEAAADVDAKKKTISKTK